MSGRTAHFDRAWPLLEPAVARARQHTRETVFDAIARGKSQLWMLDGSAAVTTLYNFPCGRKSFHVWLVGGELGELVDWSKGAALRSAIASGCNEMRVNGRRGWVRAFGWREAGAVAVNDFDAARSDDHG